MQRKGNSFYLNGLLCGIKQLNPQGGWLPHSPTEGWQIDTPPIHECNKIYLQDDVTFRNNKILELEKYIKHYGDDVKKITFYTWHKGLIDLYPTLNLKWYPLFLKDHLLNALKYKDLLEKELHFENKTNKFLCLNARIRPHRDVIFRHVKDNKNCVSSYTYRGFKSPLADDWEINDYMSWNNGNPDLLVNTKNLLVASPMYNQTSFSLVTETRNTLPFDFVTEKTTQCFLALHPALFVSNRYHVATLREWGFDVFDDIFDHSYDEVDNEHRIGTLLKDNQKIIENGFNLDDSIKKRLYANRHYYFTKFIEILKVEQ